MAPRPIITGIETFEFTIELRGIAVGAKLPGVLLQDDKVIRSKRCAIRIDTDLGVSGECVGPRRRGWVVPVRCRPTCRGGRAR